MKKIVLVLLLFLILAVPANAQELTAPEVTGDAALLLPEGSHSFAEDLLYVLRSAMAQFLPGLTQCAGICLSLIAMSMLLSLLGSAQGQAKAAVELCGVIGISVLLMGSAHAMIQLASETVVQLSDYGKLLLPVLTAALAASGGTGSSAALYAGTAVFDAVLCAATSAVLVPMVYIYLVTAVVNAAVCDEMMKKLRDFIKWLLSWAMKLVLYVFTGFISITGIVTGTADQAALKATKMTLSSMVPVVGGILSDASETVLVSAGLVKNSVGVYGLLALIAVLILPFMRIGAQYGLLRLTAAACGLFTDKKLTGLMEDFAGAMGLLLGQTGTVCLILLISVVCFLRGVG